MAATLSSVYGPGVGVPMPVLIVSARPPMAENRPVSTYAMSLVRDDVDAAPERGELVAADGVDGEPESGSAGAGSR